MFKELKVIKLLILVSLLTGILFKMNFSKLTIKELYTNQLSYLPGDTVKIYCSSKGLPFFKLPVSITDLEGNKITSVNLPIIKQPTPLNPLRDGLNFQKYTNFIIPTNFKSGIYKINNIYPLIVKTNNKSDVTVVYPYMNNIVYTPVNEQNVFNKKLPFTSLLRTSTIDPYTSGMSIFFTHLNANYNVNYISDVELENYKNFSSSKILIVYGKSTFWTPKMKQSLEQFTDSGKNILNITSFFANNICWKKNNTQIQLVDSSKTITSWYSYDTIMPISIAGVEHNKAGLSPNKKYIINKKEHSIFNNINSDSVLINATLFSAPPVFRNNKKPFIDYYKLKYYHGEILAYSDATYKGKKKIKGIFLLKKSKNSGQVLSLGTEDWCLQKNIGEQEQLQTITKNAVSFLIEN